MLASPVQPPLLAKAETVTKPPSELAPPTLTAHQPTFALKPTAPERVARLSLVHPSQLVKTKVFALKQLPDLLVLATTASNKPSPLVEPTQTAFNKTLAPKLTAQLMALAPPVIALHQLLVKIQAFAPPTVKSHSAKGTDAKSITAPLVPLTQLASNKTNARSLTAPTAVAKLKIAQPAKTRDCALLKST